MHVFVCTYVFLDVHIQLVADAALDPGSKMCAEHSLHDTVMISSPVEDAHIIGKCSVPPSHIGKSHTAANHHGPSLLLHALHLSMLSSSLLPNLASSHNFRGAAAKSTAVSTVG